MGIEQVNSGYEKQLQDFGAQLRILKNSGEPRLESLFQFVEQGEILEYLRVLDTKKIDPFLQETIDGLFEMIRDFSSTNNVGYLDSLPFALQSIQEDPSYIAFAQTQTIDMSHEQGSFGDTEQRIISVVDEVRGATTIISAEMLKASGNVEAARDMAEDELVGVQAKIQDVDPEALAEADESGGVENDLRSTADLLNGISVHELENVTEIGIVDEAVGRAEELSGAQSMKQYINMHIRPQMKSFQQLVKQVRGFETVQKRYLLAQKEVIVKLGGLLFVINNVRKAGFALDDKENITQLLRKAVISYNSGLVGSSFKSLHPIDFNELLTEIESRKAVFMPKIDKPNDPGILYTALDAELNRSASGVANVHAALHRLGIPIPELDNE